HQFKGAFLFWCQMNFHGCKHDRIGIRNQASSMTIGIYWENHSVEFQKLPNGIQYFIDIPKHELPLRLNIVGHGSRSQHIYMINKNHPDHFTPQKLFNNIKELLNKRDARLL
uniref:hypothetical protein n=1 Tax=Xenorhabdus entomophaga TaxID=3136257 RepID=UPI0030F47580